MRRGADRFKRFGAAFSQRFELVARAIVDADVVAALEQAPRHGLTHAANPDESDLHKLLLTLIDRSALASSLRGAGVELISSIARVPIRVRGRHNRRCRRSSDFPAGRPRYRS